MPENTPLKKTRPLPRKPTADSLRAAALAYLERFPASTARLRQVLDRKIARYCRLSETEHTPQEWSGTIETLIAGLRNAGYLDDTAYAQGLARSLALRGTSARMMASRMSARGLAPDVIAQALARQKEEQAETGMEGDFPSALRFARRRRIGPFAQNTGAGKSEEKALATLARAGFDYETAQRVMRTHRHEAEAILDRALT